MSIFHTNKCEDKYIKNTINVKCLFTLLHRVTHTVLRTSGNLVHSLMSCQSTGFHALNTLDGRVNLAVLSQWYLAIDTTDNIHVHHTG